MDDVTCAFVLAFKNVTPAPVLSAARRESIVICASSKQNISLIFSSRQVKSCFESRLNDTSVKRHYLEVEVSIVARRPAPSDRDAVRGGDEGRKAGIVSHGDEVGVEKDR